MDYEEFQGVIVAKREIAKQEAWKALSRYKFWMFGYWAARWVELNNLCKSFGEGEPSPFAPLVKVAREIQ